MKLQVGEKVRFLNEAVEGTVTRILNNDRVEVTDQFGFTHAAPEKLLVRVEFDHAAEPDLPEDEPIEQKKTQAPVKNPAASIISALDNDETIYAAVSMLENSSPLTSDLELKLVNNCSSGIAYTISKKNDEMRTGVLAGILKPKTETLVGVYSQDELHRFNGFHFWFLFFSEGVFRPRPPAEKSLKFSSSDFVEGENWEAIRHRDQKTMLMPLYVLGREAGIDVQKLLEKYESQQADFDQRTPGSGKRKKGDKFVILNKEKTVDLHIESLLKDYSSMSNSQIISHQLKTFQYEMDQAILNHYYKITFVHGVGEGILKSAIKEELKKYSGIKFGEAPYEKFGHGATEVLFT